MTTQEGRDLQRAFTGLLRCPVVDSRAQPELWTLVRHPRRRAVLTEWFANRLGYRLIVTESAARLVRTPIGGQVLAPRPFEPPPRRVLVLALLAAVAAEDADDVTTTQDLSDRVRALTRHEDVRVSEYDPDRFAERLLFVKAMHLLTATGALRPSVKGLDDQLEGWAHQRDAIGGAYHVQRELLLRVLDPSALQAALHPDRVIESEPGPAVRHSIMRRLLELPVLLYADLDEAEMTYLSNQRSRILGWCVEMTGWTVEQRREGIALVATDEADTDLPFPRLRAVDFLAISVLDVLIKLFPDGGPFGEASVRQAVATVRARHPKAMTKDLTSDAAAARRVMEILCALDLARPSDFANTWSLTPPAHRFRSPKVVAVGQQLEIE